MEKQYSKIIILIALMFTTAISKAQTPMQITGLDCNGTNHDMFSELDAGKAVVVFFFMDACSSCPPPAQKIQTMVNNILVSHPNMVTAYAMPYNNSTTCTATANWVMNNNVMLYAPYDSGAVQVANYGGFGMPTVVLLGGKAPDRRTMFVTQSFSTSDTTIMRDSILALFTPAGLNDIPSNINSIEVFPNPSISDATIQIDLKEIARVKIEVIDMTGKVVKTSEGKQQQGIYKEVVNTNTWSNGMYTIKIDANGKTVNRKLNVSH